MPPSASCHVACVTAASPEKKSEERRLFSDFFSGEAAVTQASCHGKLKNSRRYLIKTNLDKHFNKKINDSKTTWRFDDFMSSLPNE